MKNISCALLFALVGSLSACSSAGSSPPPTPTVTVPPVQTAEPVVEKPADDKPTGPEVTPPPEEAPSARLALQQCSDEARAAKSCTQEVKPVCAEVDTGIRCIRAPCPSTMQRTFDNVCTACREKTVRGYWTMSCEAMSKSTAP